MLPNEIKRKLEDIIQGNVIEESGDACTAARNYLCRGYSTDTTVKKDFEGKQRIKKEQAANLQSFAVKNGIFWEALPQDWQYLTRGGESLVYLSNDGLSVVKLNDAIYYATWLEYFNSLVIHNVLFPDTGYSLKGFIDFEGRLHAVVSQRFIRSNETADLHAIRAYLQYNGFIHSNRQDYFHPKLRLILEDMHDENVIQKEGQLLFIDTVFYISIKQ